MKEDFGKVKKLLDEGDAKGAWHELGTMLHGHGGAQPQDSGGNGPPPPPPPKNP